MTENLVRQSDLAFDLASSPDDQDTLMSEAGSATGDTPRTMSIAPSESTRASTPTEVRDVDVSTQPMTPKAVRHISVNDDVPMIDISPGMHELAVSPKADKSTGNALSPAAPST